MRVLVLAPAYDPYVGGAETYARTIAEGLHSLGHEVTVFTDGARVNVGRRSEPVRVVRSHRFQIDLNDETKLLWEQMAFSLNEDVKACIDEIGIPDIIFANSNETALLGRMLGDSYQVPVIAAFHEQEPERGPLGRGRARLVYERLELAAILAGSLFYRDKALAFGARPERVHHVPHGVDVQLFSPGNGPSSAGREIKIVLSGRFAPRKQQDLMVRVIARLREERGLDVRLLLAGKAHSSSVAYFEAIHDQIRTSNLENVVEVREDLALQDMPDVYRAADIVVQPSRAEGLGLAVLEAMACARPVVVSDTTGLREIVRNVHDGVLVQPQSETEWVDVLDHLARDSTLREALGRNARELVVREFSVESMVSGTEEIMRSIVATWVYPEQSEV